MLFPSQVFLLLFLPLTLLAYYGARASERLRVELLALASCLFYAWWDVRFLPLLVATIALNWLIAAAYVRTRHSACIVFGVAFNLAVLGLFKYTNFVAESVLGLLGVAFEPWTIILPLGISFFTFQQISYLVDLRRADAPLYTLPEYAAYVAFFPQLIAGPIVRHNELIPQFRRVTVRAPDAQCIARGLILLILGLGKKVFLADKLAPLADVGFGAADLGTPGYLPAWQAATAYSLQLYFDFSSYSDMAMGLAGLFGFDLPLNFDKPYRATSVREFWRRWHMTLSRFLRDYLYIPLGGSRHGALRTYVVALITMLLCGLWHGAGWTFVAWGGLHGLGLCANRWWGGRGWTMPRGLAWLLTLLFVIVGWVLFRAESFSVAAHVLGGMGGMAGAGRFDDDGWIVVGLGAALALLGPSNVELSRGRLVTTPWARSLLALLLVAVLMRVGQGRALEFIYFQF
ncbi:MAG: MBOAT family protein [Gammaproteobacteria bacterium]|nr:MBOAT family protein [Gammaproteobacteria bacterium]MCP5200996.1 MBOAT family protein [Gammaproteobacteria bacterium]